MLITVATGVAVGERGEANAEDLAASSTEFRAGADRDSGDELEAKRTQTSRTYRLPNGGHLTRIYEPPINFKAPNGELTPIDTRLSRATDGTARNGDNRFEAVLPERVGNGPMPPLNRRALDLHAIARPKRGYRRQARRGQGELRARRWAGRETDLLGQPTSNLARRR